MPVAGDRRRHRRAARGRPAGRRRDREHGPPAGPRRPRSASSCSRAPSTAASWSPAWRRSASPPTTPLVDAPARGGSPPRRAPRASRTASARSSRSWTSRRTSCRSCRAASTWRASTSWPRSLTERGARMSKPTTHQSTRASARIGPLVATHDPAAGPRRRRPARRPQPRASSCAAAPAGSARPPPRRPWRCGRPSAVARSSCSPSTRPAGWRSRWGSRRSTTPRGRCPGARQARPAAARSTR